MSVAVNCTADTNEAFLDHASPKQLATRGLTRDSIGGMAVSWSPEIVYLIPLRQNGVRDEVVSTAHLSAGHQKGPNDPFVPEMAWEKIQDIMQDPKITKIAFQLKLHLNFLRLAGVMDFVGPFADPRIAHWINKPDDNRLLSIGHLFNHYVKIGDAVGSNLRASPASGGRERSLIPQDPQQCALQVWKSLRLMNKLHHILSTQKLLKSFQDVEMPLVPILAAMEWAGIGFDKTRYSFYTFEVISKLQYLEMRAHELAGKKFNLDSSTAVAEILFKDLGMFPEKYHDSKRKTKKLLAPNSVLERLMRRENPHPLPAIVREYRQLNDYVKKYAVSLPNTAIYNFRQEMFRVHATILQVSCATGRLKVKSPNVQNVTKEIRFLPVHRYTVQVR